MTKNVFFPKEILNDIIKGEFKYRGGFAGLDWKSDSLRVYGRIILQQFLPQAIAKKKMHLFGKELLKNWKNQQKG